MRDPALSDKPLIGNHDAAADALANLAYFRDQKAQRLAQIADAENYIRGAMAESFGVKDIPTFEDHPAFLMSGTSIKFVTRDSGVREDFPTGSRRDTREGKGRYDLLPPYAISRLAAVFERGAAKYGDRNWEKGQPLTRFLDSALRHTFQVLEGKTDEDHAGQAAWNLLAFIEIQQRIVDGLLPAELNDL